MAKEKKEGVEAEEEASPPPKVSKKKKFLLIILGAVALVLVVVVGGVIYLVIHKPAANQPYLPQGEAGQGMDENDQKPPIYEKLDTFTVNLADQQSYLQVEMDLKVADSETQEKIKERMPDVRDALLRLLSSKSAEELSTPEGKEALAKEVQKAINRIIGARRASEGVKGVLFTAFIIQ
jgi:flagellar FliL protein